MNRAVLKEYKELLKKRNTLRSEAGTLPKGNLRVRNINGRDYYYLQFREGNHVRSRYVKKVEVSTLSKQIERRNKIKDELKTVKTRLDAYELALGVHSTYRPVKEVDYQDYTLFISSLAHDYKRLGHRGFLEKYDISKYRGLNKRYLRGFIDYITGIENRSARKTNDLVLDPYTHLMYFKYGDKSVLEQELKKAIPAFLNQGLLVTSIQEAVHGASNN